MPPTPQEPPGEESLRAEAAEWYARMRGPDAERHRAAFEAWLAAHPGHKPAYDRMVLRWDQSGLVGHTPSGQAREGLPEAPVRRVVPMRYYALAASLVAVIALGALLLASPFGRPEAPPQVAASLHFESPVGTIRRVTLDDGSVVTLDTGTRLEVVFTAVERRLRLVAGRARFEVAHDAARPFIVAAGEGEVVATGTVFDVSLVGERPRVRLIQGAVEVRGRSSAEGAPAPRIATLAPGQAIVLGAPEAQPSPAPPVEERWVSGMLSFDGTPLADAVAEANRYSERRIVLGDPGLATLRVSGAFKAGEQETIAAALAASFGLRVVPGPDGLTLIR